MIQNTEEETNFMEYIYMIQKDVLVELCINYLDINHDHFSPISMGMFWCNPHGFDGIPSYVQRVIDE